MNENPYKSPQHSSTARIGRLRRRWVGFILAGLLFLASLATGTLKTDRGGEGFLLGIICLLFGWGIHLSWYANPLLLLSGALLLAKRPLGAACSAAVAISLMLTALQIKEIYINEGGTKGPVTGYGVGFYLWVCSGGVLLVTALLSMRGGRQRVENSNEGTTGSG
jgi:hypothetical protein